MHAHVFMCSVPQRSGTNSKCVHNMMHRPWPDAAIAPGGTTSFKLVDGSVAIREWTVGDWLGGL